MRDREQWLADTFVEVATTIVDDFDLVELLTMLVERCVVLLDAAEVGLVLRDQQGRLGVLASSTKRMREVELFELQSAEGPCLDCLHTGLPVDVQLLDETARQRWPRFQPMARDAGYRAVMALPMRLRATAIGAVNVFLDHDRPPSSETTLLAQALAGAATIAIVQQRTLEESTEVVTQLQYALDARVVIEQAKGMVAEQQDVDVADAFERMRTHARDRNHKIRDVAQAIIERRLEL